MVGDTHIGVAELRPDSRYNKDAAFFQTNYTVSTDILQVIAKGPPNACLDYGIVKRIDQLMRGCRACQACAAPSSCRI